MYDTPEFYYIVIGYFSTPIAIMLKDRDPYEVAWFPESLWNQSKSGEIASVLHGLVWGELVTVGNKCQGPLGSIKLWTMPVNFNQWFSRWATLILALHQVNETGIFLSKAQIFLYFKSSPGNSNVHPGLRTSALSRSCGFLLWLSKLKCKWIYWHNDGMTATLSSTSSLIY